MTPNFLRQKRIKKQKNFYYSDLYIPIIYL